MHISAVSAGPFPKSATACGAWAAGRDRMTTSRSRRSSASIALGCTFFDTALAYGDGKSEQLLGRVLAAPSRQDAASSPPRSRRRTEVAGAAELRARRRLPRRSHPRNPRKQPENLGLTSVDLQQFHVWTDAWADDDRWQRAVDDLKREGSSAASASASIAGSRPTSCKALAHGRRRQRAGRLQHLRPEPGGRTVPALPRARRRGDRARAVRRRQPDRHADARHDAGPRATGATSTSRATSSPRRSTASIALAAGRAGRHDAARARAAVHPGQPGRLDGHSRACGAPRHVEANLAVSDGSAARRRRRSRGSGITGGRGRMSFREQDVSRRQARRFDGRRLRPGRACGLLLYLIVLPFDAEEFAVKPGIHPKYSRSRSPLRVRQHVQDALDQARAAPRNLQRLPPVLHGPPEADRHRRPRRAVHQAVRRADGRGPQGSRSRRTRPPRRRRQARRQARSA